MGKYTKINLNLKPSTKNKTTATINYIKLCTKERFQCKTVTTIFLLVLTKITNEQETILVKVQLFE